MVDEPDTEYPRLRVLALRFRSALDLTHATLDHPEFKSFPRGACAISSILLGRYLEDEGCGVFGYVNRVRPKWINGIWDRECHSWLVSRQLIVDITADQFDNAMPAVFLGHDSAWHRKFEADRSDDATPYTSYFEYPYPGLYAKIRNVIDQAPYALGI